MPKKISQNIQNIREQILAEGEAGGPVSTRIREQSILALKHGIESADWVLYMSNFADGNDQLRRLCGRDETFNETPYGTQLIAYVAAAGPCTVNTGLRLVTDDMDQDMKDRLDDGV